MMLRISWIFAALLAIPTGRAEAQQFEPPKWDASATIGLLSADPSPTDEPYSDDWYFVGRYAASIGRYWTDHFKTELELVTSNGGERYVQRFSNVPGVPPAYTYSVHERHTLRQVSGRMVWQFFENAWVHPYVFGGVAYDADRQQTFVPLQYYAPDARAPASQLIVAPADNATKTVDRVGVIGGFGAKVYLSRNAFFNTALVVSHAKPARTASIIGGFGIDF
jgi:hypothetical protein